MWLESAATNTNANDDEQPKQVIKLHLRNTTNCSFPTSLDLKQKIKFVPTVPSPSEASPCESQSKQYLLRGDLRQQKNKRPVGRERVTTLRTQVGRQSPPRLEKKRDSLEEKVGKKVLHFVNSNNSSNNRSSSSQGIVE